MVVNTLWHGPGNIHGFVLDGQAYGQGYAVAQTPTVPTVSGVRISASIKCVCNPTSIACGRWSLVVFKKDTYIVLCKYMQANVHIFLSSFVHR